MKDITYAWLLNSNWKEYYDFFDTDEDRTHFLEGVQIRAEALLSLDKKVRFLVRINSEPELCIAEMLLSLKSDYPNLHLEMLIPYEELTNNWPDASRERYFNTLSKSDTETILEHHPTEQNLEKQYRYLLTHANQILLFLEDWTWETTNLLCL